MKQLSGLDAGFIAMERPHAPLHIGSLLIFDPSTAPGGFVRFKDILDFVGKRLHIAKMLRRRLVRTPLDIDYPYWIEDPDFDLEYHIRHIALPKPGDWRQLCIQSARLFARPMDLTRPPWEITVIEGLDNVEGVPPGCYAMMVKFHHSAVDGQGSGQALLAILDTPELDEFFAQNKEWHPEKEPNKIDLFVRGYFKALFNPIRQIGVVTSSIPALFRMARGVLSNEYDVSAMTEAPKIRFNERITSARVFGAESLPLEGIKAIRDLSPGCKVNDVMLSLVGGALRKYLDAHGELPNESLSTAVPISVRTEEEWDKEGNEVTGMVIRLGTHIDDPAKRLVSVHDETAKNKAMTHAVGARRLAELNKSAPMFSLGLAARLFVDTGLSSSRAFINTIITNVPGGSDPMYSTGAKLCASYGMMCLPDGMGLGHTVTSYLGNVTASFTACRKMMPDPEFYSQCIRDSYDEHINAVGYKPKPAKRKTSRNSAKPNAASRSKRKTKSSPTQIAPSP